MNSIHLFQSMYYYHCHRRPQCHLALDFSDRSISLFRLPNATFELRIHLHLPCSPFSSVESPLAKADVELTSHGEHLIVSGISRPHVGAGVGRAYGDSYFKLHPNAYGTLVWTDQPCGHFGRDVRLGLSPGTEVRSLELAMLSSSADTLQVCAFRPPCGTWGLCSEVCCEE